MDFEQLKVSSLVVSAKERSIGCSSSFCHKSRVSTLPKQRIYDKTMSNQQDDDAPLPLGWTRHFSRTKGQFFYKHRLSGRDTWTLPTVDTAEELLAAASRPRRPSSRPNRWGPPPPAPGGTGSVVSGTTATDLNALYGDIPTFVGGGGFSSLAQAAALAIDREAVAKKSNMSDDDLFACAGDDDDDDDDSHLKDNNVHLKDDNAQQNKDDDAQHNDVDVVLQKEDDTDKKDHDTDDDDDDKDKDDKDEDNKDGDLADMDVGGDEEEASMQPAKAKRQQRKRYVGTESSTVNNMKSLTVKNVAGTVATAIAKLQKMTTYDTELKAKNNPYSESILITFDALVETPTLAGEGEKFRDTQLWTLLVGEETDMVWVGENLEILGKAIQSDYKKPNGKKATTKSVTKTFSKVVTRAGSVVSSIAGKAAAGKAAASKALKAAASKAGKAAGKAAAGGKAAAAKAAAAKAIVASKTEEKVAWTERFRYRATSSPPEYMNLHYGPGSGAALAKKMQEKRKRLKSDM